MVILFVFMVLFNVVSTLYVAYRVLTRFSRTEVNAFMDRFNAPKPDGVTTVI